MKLLPENLLFVTTFFHCSDDVFQLILQGKNKKNVVGTIELNVTVIYHLKILKDKSMTRDLKSEKHVLRYIKTGF